jgi:hypothetical protein
LPDKTAVNHAAVLRVTVSSNLFDFELKNLRTWERAGEPFLNLRADRDGRD